MPNVGRQSAQDVIASALRLVGALGSGEVPTASEIQDAGLVLNQMLDAWNAERLMVFTVTPVPNDSNGKPLVLVANQQSYKLGNAIGTEDFFLPRPARLERVSVFYSASQATPNEIPLDMYDNVQWQGIANKTTPSILPQICYDDGGFPDRTLYFWPTPTQANPITLYLWTALMQFSDLTLPMSFPPGYMEAIRYNLAVRLFAEFPGDPQKFAVVNNIAQSSKARLMSINAPMKVATVDEALLGGNGRRGNIYSGDVTRSHNY